MANYKITGVTYENGAEAGNLIVVYKADRNDLASFGQELSRATADPSTGLFEVEWADWDKHVFVLAVDVTTGTQYESKALDWITPVVGGYDPLFAYVVSLMHMEGSGQAFIDEIGNTVTAHGEVQHSVVQAKYGGSSVSFDGSGNDWVAIDYTPGFDISSQDFCVEFWAYLPAAIGYQTFVSTRSLTASPSSNEGLIIRSYNTDMQVYLAKTGTTWMSDTAAGTVPVGEWFHVAVTRDAGSIYRVFVNGVANGNGFVDSSTPVVNARDVLLGCEDNGSNPLAGYMDEFRFTVGQARYVSDFVLPVSEFPGNIDPLFSKVVSLLHMEGVNGEATFTDEIGNVVTASGNAVTSSARYKFGNTSAYFDGASGTRLQIDYDPSFQLDDKDFTIECWARFTGFPSTSNLVFCNRNANTQYGQFVCYVSSAGVLQFYLRTATSTWSSDLSAGNITLNQWTHIAISRKGSVVRIFINGVQTGGFLTTAAVPGDSYNIYLGGEGNNTNRFQGYIDEFRFTVGSSRYNKGFPVPLLPFQDS